MSLALASSIPVLGLASVCRRKGWPWPRIFLCPWPWPRALCPRLHLCKAHKTVESLKNGLNKQLNLIVTGSLKMLNVGFIKKVYINLEIGGRGGGCSALIK